MKDIRILVIDDDAVACELLSDTLSPEGYQVKTLTVAKEALTKDLSSYSLLLSDIRMPGMDGLTLLKAVKEKQPNLPVILMTSYGSMETTMEALRSGAWDYISKPFSPAAIRALVKKVIEVRELNQIRVTSTPAGTEQKAHFIGCSSRMVDFYKQIARIANSQASVLIEGESGTGKELASRSLHQMSEHADKPFIVVHCGAIPDTLLESEMFGYEKGSFTGADKSHAGLLEVAQHGTMFFDEIGEMSTALQGKLLRFMQSGEIRRIGGHETKIVSVRVVAATNRHIDEDVGNNLFRADLLYRFVVRLTIPSLRERKEDIPLLVESILEKLGYAKTRISDDAMQLFMAYDWPGNVRELENTIQHVLLMTPYSVILPENLPDKLHGIHTNAMLKHEGTPSLLSPLEEAQREQILLSLQSTNWNQSQTAIALGIDRKTLRSRIQRYNLAKNP